MALPNPAPPMTRRRPSASPISVWIVEDHEEFRQSVFDMLAEADGIQCEFAYASAEALLEGLNLHFAPDVMLMDLGLPGMSGIEAIEKVKAISPATQIIVLSIHENNDRIFDAICKGATGYLLKTSRNDEIVEAIRQVRSGGAAMTPQIARRMLNMFAQLNAPRWDYQLTAREREVLRELVAGRTKEQMAGALDLSYHTVDTHLRNIYAKLHVNSRSAAIAKALTEKLIKGPSLDES